MPEFVKAARTCPQSDFLPELHSVWYLPSVWNCSPKDFPGMTYSGFKSSMNFPHRQNVSLKLSLLEYALDTIPPRQDLMLPSLGGICMTPCHSFCLRKGGLACFDLPSMLGALVKTSWRLKRRMTMKSQTHERRLEFSGAVAGAQKESWPVDYKNWCAASGQSCQRQTMQEEGAGAQLAHTVYMNLKSLP